jgi:hypothetical protein
LQPPIRSRTTALCLAPKLVVVGVAALALAACDRSQSAAGSDADRMKTRADNDDGD